MTQARVKRDTGRAFAWLLGVSLLLHLLLTPLAGLLGFVEAWLTRPTLQEDAPPEQLKELPVELFEEELAEKPVALPEEDPVKQIDELVELPVVPAELPKPAPKPKPKPAPKPEPTATQTPNPEPPDAGAPAVEPVPTAPSSSASAEPTTLPPTAPVASGAPSGVTAEPPRPVASADERHATPPRGGAIDDPVALAGKGAKLVEKQTSVGLVLYMDRVRSHPLGKRIGALLPKLPQWDEFFGSHGVNPVADFDRMYLLGPSFVDSSGLVIAIEHHMAADKLRGAVDELVKKRGSWVSEKPVPTALTYADRAERAILFPTQQTVVIVPPHLREQAVKQGIVGVPKAKGPEALVAFTVNPAKALRRFGLDLPASLESAKLRLTPLPNSEVLVEIEARDESAAQAQKNATLLTQQLNAIVDLVSGMSNILGSFGFGGLVPGVDLPRVTLKADGAAIKGRQVLTSAQVTFLMTQLEREFNRMAARRAAPKTTPAPAPSVAPRNVAPTPSAPRNVAPAPSANKGVHSPSTSGTRR